MRSAARSEADDRTREHRAVFARCLAAIDDDAFVLRVPAAASAGPPPRIRHFHPQPEVFVQVMGVSRLTFPDAHLGLRPGEICGYADSGYFARQFRRLTGLTASVYRGQVDMT
jgi:hypothetical protein